MTPVTEVTPRPWPQFRRELETVYAPLAPATRGKLRQVLEILEGLGITSTTDLSPALITRFLASRPNGQSPHTTKCLLSTLRAVCGHAEELGYASSPFRLRRMKLSRLVKAPPPAGKRHLTAEECRALLATLRADVLRLEPAGPSWPLWRARRLESLVSFVLYTGVRRNEALFLQVGDLDIPGRIVRLVPHNPRGALKTPGSADSIPMPEALIPSLEAWLAVRLGAPEGMSVPPCPWVWPGATRRGPWHEGSPGHRPLDKLQDAARRAGIGHVTWHMLRRSLATHLEAHGVGTGMVARILRHTDERTTVQHYIRRDEANMRRAVDGFTY
jgi:integrase